MSHRGVISARRALLLVILSFAGMAVSLPETCSASGPEERRKTTTLTPAQQAACAAAFFESLYDGEIPPEAVRMLVAILRGSKMGPGEGWFGPAQTRYTWEWLARQCGVDPDSGSIPRNRFRGPATWFARLDRNGDGVITPDDLDWSDQNPYLRISRTLDWLFRRLNTAGNGQLSKQELLQFFDKAAKGKDYLTLEDFRTALLAGALSKLDGDLPEQRTLLRALFRGDIGSLYEGPRLNEPAPHFALKTVEGTQTIQLTQLLGSKPLVLVFGSFTCGPFRAQVPAVEELYQRYRDQANFLAIYVREAHPTDGWHMASNERAGITIPQPRNWNERQVVAQKCRRSLSLTIPLVVDTMDDHVGHAYSGMPSRLYLIDRTGRIAYKSGRGPFGFKPGELEQALIMLLLAEQTPAVKENPMKLKPLVEKNAAGRLPLLSLAETWRRLPTAPVQTAPLPIWARMLAGLFPQTTGRLLELDALHRRGDRLDARLRCLARWSAAQATGCTYSQAMATADFRRAGGQMTDWQQATQHPERLPLVDRLVMAFARQLLLQPVAVSDEAFQQLLDVLGEERTVALVALLAHAAFQDRLFLALGVSAESEEPPPPVEFSFLWPAPAKTSSAAPSPLLPALPMAETRISEEWRHLQAALEQQQRRPGRIRVPSRTEVLRRLGPDHPARWQSDILWSRVCYGYQPELTDAWFACVAAFRQEAQIDAVFGNCLFWVATQARQCFY